MFSTNQKKFSYTNVAFFNAAADGKIDHLKDLFQKYGNQINLNQTYGDNKRFSLYKAAEMGHVEVVKYLLEKRCDIDLRTTNGQTALFAAVSEGRDKIVRCLLDAGANPDIPSRSGDMPLDIAVIKNNPIISEMLDGHAQGFHTALIQRMKVLGYMSSHEGVCFGFSETLKKLISTNNEAAIAECYKMLAWLKQSKAWDLYLIKIMHDALITVAEQKALKHFNVSNEHELNLAQHTQFQQIVKDKLALRRSQLTKEEQEDESQYLYIKAFFDSLELAHLNEFYLYLFPKHKLHYLPDAESYKKSYPIKGQILLAPFEHGILKYKSILSNQSLLEYQFTLEELKSELHDHYDDFASALQTNNSIKLNFYLETILTLIAQQKHKIVERDIFSQSETPFWVNSIVQPQILEQKRGEVQLTKFTGVYSKADLLAYLTRLRHRINQENPKITVPVVLNLNSIDHRILVVYHPDKQWEFMDINQISSKPSEIKRIFLTDEKEIVARIKKGIASGEYAVMNTRVTATQDVENQIRPVIEKWENDLRDMHAPTPEKIKFSDESKGTWFLTAAIAGDEKSLQRLLTCKAAIDPNQTNSEGSTALLIAVSNSDMNTVRILMDYKASIDPNKGNEDTKSTPLLIAAQNGYLGMVNLLLAHPRIDPNKGLLNGATPLYLAAQNGHVEVVKALLNHPDTKANKARSDNTTPLYIAAQNGHLEVVKALLDDPFIDIDRAVDKGYTAFDVAAINKHDEIVQMLQDFKDKQERQMKAMHRII